jgi:hypothetical protein
MQTITIPSRTEASAGLQGSPDRVEQANSQGPNIRHVPMAPVFDIMSCYGEAANGVQQDAGVTTHLPAVLLLCNPELMSSCGRTPAWFCR